MILRLNQLYSVYYVYIYIYIIIYILYIYILYFSHSKFPQLLKMLSPNETLISYWIYSEPGDAAGADARGRVPGAEVPSPSGLCGLRGSGYSREMFSFSLKNGGVIMVK